MPPQDVLRWSDFENIVAQIYRLLGAQTVKENVNLSGHQIDVYVEERTGSGQVVRAAVECKFYEKKVGKDVVTNFCIIADFLKKAGQVDKAILVAYNGFTKEASLSAAAMGVELVSFAELEVQLASKSPQGMGIIDEIVKRAEAEPQPEIFKDEVFVVMPFSDELNDLYIYGIRGSVEKSGLTAVRGDEVEFNSDILVEIIERIRKSEYIVAEVSDRNPNVFYEVGWAHALDRPVILIARTGTELPFDLQGKNHILYNSINDLEKNLTKRLKAMKDENKK